MGYFWAQNQHIASLFSIRKMNALMSSLLLALIALVIVPSPGLSAIHNGDEQHNHVSKFDGYVKIAFSYPSKYRRGGRISHYQKKSNGTKSKHQKTPYHLGGKLPNNKHIKTYNPENGLDFFDDELDPYRAKKLNRNSGGYRTMCVRLRDGYYWPISFSTSKSRFKKDRIKCQKSCSDKVRLFYYANPGQDIADMRDLKGKRYASLKNAFLYRTKYVKEASCKPKPWSKEAKALHKVYAKKDLVKKQRRHIAATKRAERKRLATLRRLLRKKTRYYRKKYRKKIRYRRKASYIRRRKKSAG